MRVVVTYKISYVCLSFFCSTFLCRWFWCGWFWDNLQTGKTIQVSGFDEDTVALFVKLLQQNDDKDMDLKWKEIVNLMELSDFYQSKAALDICIERGSKLITLENVFEVITVIDQCNIDVWYDACIDMLLTGENMVTIQADARWNSALSNHSNVMVYILDGMHRRQRSTDEHNQCIQHLKYVYDCIKDKSCICYCNHSPRHLKILRSINGDFIPSGVSENVWKDLLMCFMASCLCSCKHTPKHFNILKDCLCDNCQ